MLQVPRYGSGMRVCEGGNKLVIAMPTHLKVFTLSQELPRVGRQNIEFLKYCIMYIVQTFSEYPIILVRSVYKSYKGN